MTVVCSICGNESEDSGRRCPFCGNTQTETEPQEVRTFVHKAVNLEEGRPVVDVALHRLHEMIDDAIMKNINVLTIIHGYGSSGKGGIIRSECRKTLDHMKSSRLIRDYIVGENFHKRSGQVKSLLQRFPQLSANNNLNKNNKGITLVIIS